MSSRDGRDYAPPPRDYPYREYSGHSSSRDDYGSGSRGYRCVNILKRVCVCDGSLRIQLNIILFLSDRDGYGGGREPRGYMDRPSSGSYRDPYDSYGKIKPLVWWKGLRGSTQTACFAPGKGCLVSLPKSGNIKCAASFHPECSTPPKKKKLTNKESLASCFLPPKMFQ